MVHYNLSRKILELLLSEYSPDKVQALQANLTSKSDTVGPFTQATSSFGPIHVFDPTAVTYLPLVAS